MANIAKIFVIIVTYKGHQWYERCLTSLRQSDSPVQTVVIDNASNDGTVEYIREHFPEIHIIESKDNLGFGRANNLGMRYALDNGADYVFLLNQDAWIEPNTITKLVCVAEKYPEYGILSPLQVNAEKSKVLNGVIDFLSYPTHTCYELFNDLLLGTKKEVYSVREMNAAAWLLPRKTLEIVGGFDPIFLHYGEDWNYMSRVLYHNMKIGLLPAVLVVHDCVERVKQDKGYAATYDKWLLQRTTDLLYPDSIVDEMCKQSIKQSIVKLLTFKRKTFIENWKSFVFLRKNQKRIIDSRRQNAKEGISWL